MHCQYKAVPSQNKAFRQVAKISNNQTTVYLFTDGESVPCQLTGLFTFCKTEVPPSFSLGCIKTSGVMLPTLVLSFSAFIIDETHVSHLSIC